MEIDIRPIDESDAERFLELCLALDDEGETMMLERGERERDVDAVRARIRAMLATANSIIFVAESERLLVGYIEASGGTFRRNRHNAQIVIGVRRAFSGRGVGRQLFASLERWAREVALRRLELTVMVHNVVAIHLYERVGFVVEGRRKDSLRVNGTFVDELAMAKLLR